MENKSGLLVTYHQENLSDFISFVVTIKDAIQMVAIMDFTG